MNQTKEPHGLLSTIMPFRFLERKRREELEKLLVLQNFEAGDEAVGITCSSIKNYVSSLYFVASGRFALVSEEGAVLTDRPLGPGSIIGEQAVMFSHSRCKSVIALEKASAWYLRGDTFLQLLAEHHPPFAMALSSMLRKSPIFGHYTSFKGFVFASLHEPIKKALDTAELLARYKPLNPAIHPLCNRHRDIDFEAWAYALRRLPENITTVYSIVCSRRLINILNVLPSGQLIGDNGEPLIDISPGRVVRTEARRRTCIEVMPGKLFILLRDADTDLIDVITCICIHTVELRKLKERLRPVSAAVSNLKNGIKRIQSNPELKDSIEYEVLTTLGAHGPNAFSQDEIKAARTLFPYSSSGRLLQLILDSLIHHGDFSISIDPSSDEYVISAEELWCNKVRNLATDLVGPFDDCCGPELIVDIISSNTHSVLGSLSPYIHINRDQILAWGRLHRPNLFNTQLRNELDRLYMVAQEWLQEFPQEREIKRRIEIESGIAFLSESDWTGISVQLYDLNRLKIGTAPFDDVLESLGPVREPLSGKRHLLVNIDYCFGSQAESIM